MTRTVLIVEDDVSLRRNVSYALVEDAYEVIPAGTGGEALGHLRANVIDLILLDVGLPDCCGFSLFHEIRELTKAPVIFMTARTDDRDRIAGLEQGADDYVSKPFAVRELQVRIRNVLRRVYSPAIEIGEKHPFSQFESNIDEKEYDKLYGKMTTFYGRDREEEGTEYMTFGKFVDAVEYYKNCGAEYMYIMNNDTWYVAQGDMTELVELSEALKQVTEETV